ncbi:MAG: hypothetical protein M0R03_03500 [Novosphingobium sp.]|nr:hypothetical protein [Novosphingobium sp.]
MNPLTNQYDHGLGASEDGIINYMKESHVVQSRISSIPCYLIQLHPTGSSVGTSLSPIELDVFTNDGSNYRGTIWDNVGDKPDLRLRTDENEEPIIVLSDSVQLNRVIEVEDIEEDNEYAVVERKDLSSKRVEIVFNSGFNPNLHTIEYYYKGVTKGISNIRQKPGEDDSHSLFGWTQYLNSYSDQFVGQNQILVRLPLTSRNLTLSDEGLVVLEERDSWMIWEPYVKERDIIVVPVEYSFTGKEERFEVIDKRDSVIQRTLISQRFKLKHLEYADKRYNLPIQT